MGYRTFNCPDVPECQICHNDALETLCDCGLTVCQDCRVVCEGCGEHIGCKNCMYWNEDWMGWFCGPECVEILDKKLGV